MFTTLLLYFRLPMTKKIASFCPVFAQLNNVPNGYTCKNVRAWMVVTKINNRKKFKVSVFIIIFP